MSSEAKKESQDASAQRWQSSLIMFGSCLIVVALAFGQLKLWDSSGALAPAPWLWGAIGSICIAAVVFLRRSFLRPSVETVAFVLGIFLPLVFFSDIPVRRWMLFTGAHIRGDILIWSLVAFVFILQRRSGWLAAVALITPLCLLWSFSHEAAGRLIFSDDHATFLYRLDLLSRTFPQIPHYYSAWNAGIEMRDYFPSGVGNVFALYWPMLKLFPATESYNWIVSGHLFFLYPLLMAVTTFLITRDRMASICSVLFAVSVSLLWYRWGLKYGTMGFVVAASLVPLNVVLCARLLSCRERVAFPEAVAFVVSITLMCLWPLIAVVFVPVYIVGLFRLPRLFKRKNFLFIVIALALLNAPWMTVFVHVSKVGQFLVVEQEESGEVREHDDHKQGGATHTHHDRQWSEAGQAVVKGAATEMSVRGVLGVLQENFSPGNVLLLLLAIPGLMLIGRGWVQGMIIAQVVWLLVLGCLISTLKPQLELDRMLLVAQLLLVPGAAIALSKMIQAVVAEKRYVMMLPGVSIALGFLVAGVFATASIVQNRSDERFFFKGKLFDGLVEQVEKHAGDGRAFFTGFVLHEVGQSHIAPMTLFTDKPIMASDPIHRYWHRVDAIPKEYRTRGEAGIEEYLDLFNVTLVFAHEKDRIRYFRSRPHMYQHLWQQRRFHAFARTRTGSGGYFYSGSGEIVRQDVKSVVVRPETKDVVLKFRYLPVLEVSGCVLGPERVSRKVKLIRLTECVPGQEVVIGAKPVSSRLFG